MPRNPKRDYAKEYREYQGKPSQIKNRSTRNKARRLLEKAGVVSKGDGKDVSHKIALKKGGSNLRTNLTVQSPTKNRGWRKGKKGYAI